MNKDKRRLSRWFLAILFVTMSICVAKANASAGTVTGYEKITWGISSGRYYVNGVHAFCAQYNKSWPTVGTVVEEIVPCTNDVLRKALYYGYNGPQNTLGTDERAHILTAIAVSDANIGESETGASAKYDAFYWELVNNPSNYPSPPSNFKAYLAITASDAMQNLAFYEMEKNGYVTGIKKSANLQLDIDNPCYSLAGAQYGIYSDATLSESSKVGTLSTDANGEMNTVELPAGTYYVQELVSPKGYAKSNEATTFTIEADKTVRLEFKDAPQVNPIEILIQKVDSETNRNEPQGNAKLEGAEFTVCYYAGIWQSDEDPSTYGEMPRRTWVFQTDEYGVVRYHSSYQVSGDELYAAMPLGTVVIKETKASEGYLRNENVVVRKIYSEGDAEHMAVYNSPIVPEKVIEAKLTKYQSDTDIAISGVSFVHMAPDGTRTKLITDQNGQLILKGLQYGTHTIWESATVDGYAINGYIHSFTVDKDTEKHIEIVAYNDPAPYDLVIHKKDDYDNKLADAEFTLFEDEECLQEIQSGLTDENGVLHLYGLEVGKTYYLKETKAPPGYSIHNDKKDSAHVYKIQVSSVPVRDEFICYIDDEEYSNISGTKANREVNIEIINDVGDVLPKTGSPATILSNLAGVAICGMSLCLNRRKTKKRRENIMKKIKVLLAAVLSITVVLGTVVPTYAAEPVSDVKIEVNATDMNVSVTVPSTLPIIFCEDGTNRFPEHWTIENVSVLAGMHLKQIDLNADGTGWQLVKTTEQVKTQPVNGKDIKFFVGVPGVLKLVVPDNGSESEKGTATFEETDICIASGETQDIMFGIERGAFSESKVSAKAFTMELTFEFN